MKLQGQNLHFIKSLRISFKVRKDENMEKSQGDLIPPLHKLYSLLNKPVSLASISLRFTKNHLTVSSGVSFFYLY